ncbi:hypothetical protein KJ969_04885 [Patescibacteria group bacterium]|nr:hypothetical protein [Patescibacteria group bacterium]MBU1922108.1 hypothetical protein [Patescibacteria group bacterium]
MPKTERTRRIRVIFPRGAPLRVEVGEWGRLEGPGQKDSTHDIEVAGSPAHEALFEQMRQNPLIKEAVERLIYAFYTIGAGVAAGRLY